MEVKLENIQFSYPFSNGRLVLKNLSINIKKNEYIGIVGPTGAGKTTLLEIVKGIHKPTDGIIYYDNFQVKQGKELNRDLSLKIGLLFQFPEKQLFEETVYDDISFAPRNFGFSQSEIDYAVKRAMLLVNLDFSSIFFRSPFNLSGGEKRRVALAGVLAMNPEILMLDEPTTGVDNFGVIEVEKTLNNLYNEGKTIIVVSHDMDFIYKNVKRIIGIKDGEIKYDGDKINFFNDEILLKELKLEMPSLLRWFRNKGYNPGIELFQCDEKEIILNYKKFMRQ
ncbi:energy-coupling factor ABC transporter ATP-binding protein [candidate division KSB1 bacterium]|nr:MAG: energy-coupling factor ABC transporter ATP-binding protein [candidate division KSB1 bacterium]